MLHSIRITGSGIATPGEYDAIKVSGSGKLFGPIQCNELKISGYCKSEEAVTSKEARISGSYKSDGAFIADHLIISGNFNASGDVSVKDLRIDGVAKVVGKYINGEQIRVNGSLKNDLEINSDRLEVNGLIHAKDIVGTNVEILKHGVFSLTKGLFVFTAKKLAINKVETITCDTLYARFLKCQKICAEDITLVESDVEYIECNGVVRMDALSKVKQIDGDCEIIHG